MRDFPGPLSIKSVLRGSGLWKTEAGEFRIDEGSLLALNRQEPYSLIIDSREPVSTFCIFFEDGLVESVRRAMVTGPAELLDDPGRSAEFRFVSIAHAAAECGGLVDSMRGVSAALPDGGLHLDAAVLRVARELVLLDSRTRDEAARVPAARPATREELYRRLRRGREFMLSCHDQQIQLSDIARASCLSAWHFHRLYRETFHETPHAFLTRLRLERACRLLAKGGMSVTEVCASCGFESLGSFSSLFRRRFGASPRRYGAGNARASKPLDRVDRQV